MTLALASVSDVEAVSKAVPADSIPSVVRLIEMVSARVANYTGQTFDKVTDDSIVIQPHDGVLRLPQRPVTALTSITVGTSLISSTLYSWQPNGVVRRTSPTVFAADSQFTGFVGSAAGGVAWPVDGEWPWPPIATTVVYTHGYDPGAYPDDVAMVVAEKVAVKWLAGARQAEGTQSESIDGYSQSFTHLAHVTAGNAWDPEHKQTLDAYRRSGAASLRLG